VAASPTIPSTQIHAKADRSTEGVRRYAVQPLGSEYDGYTAPESC